MGPEWEPAARRPEAARARRHREGDRLLHGPAPLRRRARRTCRAVMLWALAAVSAGTVAARRLAPDRTTRPAIRRWAWRPRAQRYFLAIVDPGEHRRRLLDHGPPAALVPALAPVAAPLGGRPGSSRSPCSSLTGLLDELPAVRRARRRGHRLVPRRGRRPLRARAPRAQPRPSRPPQAQAPDRPATAEPPSTANRQNGAQTADDRDDETAPCFPRASRSPGRASSGRPAARAPGWSRASSARRACTPARS